MPDYPRRSLKAAVSKTSLLSKDLALETSDDPGQLIPHAVWSAVSSCPEPVVLFSPHGFEIISLNLMAQRMFEGLPLSRVRQLLETSLTKLVVERICLAARAVSGAFVQDLPAQITLGNNETHQIRLTVAAIPQYPGIISGAARALLYIRVIPREQREAVAYAKLPHELMSWVPVPVWMVGESGRVAFQNSYCSDLPLAATPGVPVDMAAVLDQARWSQRDDCADLIRRGHNEVRRTGEIFDQVFTHEARVWRLVVMPVLGLDRKPYLMGLGLQMSRNVAAVPVETTMSISEDQRLRRLQLAERELERIKLAREVHDSLGQELTVMQLTVSRVLTQLREDFSLKPEHEMQFASVEDQVQQVIRSARKIAFELRSDVLQTSGFLNAVHNLVMRMRNGTGIPGTLEVSPGWEDPTNDTLSSNMYRCVQELLNNLAKHAQATKFIVRLELLEGVYLLSVVDDGRGMPAKLREGHLGLHTLLERAEHHGGTMTLTSRPQVDGTKVLLTFNAGAVAGLDSGLATDL